MARYDRPHGGWNRPTDRVGGLKEPRDRTLGGGTARSGGRNPRSLRSCVVIRSLALSLVLLAGSLSTAAGSWTIAGTTLGIDGTTPVVGVPVTLFPDSTVVLTDAQGDFLMRWDGKKAWLTFTPDERTREGKPFCKRYALLPRPAAPGDSLLDLGTIRLVAIYPPPPTQSAFLPQGVSAPETLKVAGPQGAEAGRYWFATRVTTDIWGNVIHAEQISGDKPPERLKQAVIDWLHSITWRVSSLETPCDADKPFVATQHVSYQWGGSAWVSFVNRNPIDGNAPGQGAHE